MVNLTTSIVQHIGSIHGTDNWPVETISLRIQESVDASNA